MPVETTAVPASINPTSPSVDGGLFACVIEPGPRFENAALRWFAALTRVARVVPADLAVCVVGGETSRAIEYLRGEGVNIFNIERFDDRSPHCNKISAALTLTVNDGVVVLTDADVVVLEDARRIRLPSSSMGLKTVDAPYPPLSVLSRIFDIAGLPHPKVVPLYHVPTATSFATNGNGGVYIFQAKLLLELANAWAQWALWLLERRELLQSWRVHVDQVAMAMALSETATEVFPLDVRWNFPVHVPTWISENAPYPAIIHYHDYVDRRGRIRQVGVSSIDQRIADVNEAIGSLPADLLHSAIYQQRLFRPTAMVSAVRKAFRRCRAALGR